MHVSILVATRERPLELRRLLVSMAAIRFRRIAVPSLDVVVVDNARTPEGYDPAELTALAGIDVRVVTESNLGIPFARNRALRERHHDAIAVVFVDDDSTVTPSWLEHLLEAAADHDADFVSGPALPRFDAEIDPDLAGYLGSLRNERPEDGTELECTSTGNLLICTRWLERQDQWLDESYGTAGGSDTEWTRRSQRAGARIVHADRAQVWHHLSAPRMTRRWIRRRSYRVGQGAAERARMDGAGRWQLLGQGVAVAGRLLHAYLGGIAGRDRSVRTGVAMRAPWLAGWIATTLGAGRYQEYRSITSEAAT